MDTVKEFLIILGVVDILQTIILTLLIIALSKKDQVMVYHCFFEQSGTFKNEFKKLGFDAIDYDILNDYGETDQVIDLFEQINLAFEGGGFYIRLN